MKVGEFLQKHNLLPPQLTYDADVLEDILPTSAEDIIDQYLGTVDSAEQEKARAAYRKHIISQSQTSEGEPPLKKMRTRQSANIHKRVKALETHSKPETHVLDIAVSEATLATGAIFQTNITDFITQGSLASQRTGNEVRLKSVEVTFNFPNQPSLDCYIVRPNDANATPTLSQFSGTAGGRYKETDGWEVKHWLLGGSTASNFYNIDDRISFKYPMKVRYTGANANHNAMYFCISNHTGSAVTNLKGNIRIRFYG